MITQFIQFAGFGAIGTLVQYAILIILVQGTGGSHVILVSTAGFVAGALVNYNLNYRYMFRSKKKHHEAMAKFFSVALLGLALNGIIMALGTKLLSIHYVFVQAFATGVVLVWNFAGNVLWTFEDKGYGAREQK